MPICFALKCDSLYSAVDEKPKRSRRLKRLENIGAHPAVSVLVDHFEANWSNLWWVVAEGRAEILDTGEQASRALELLVAKYPQYQATRPGGTGHRCEHHALAKLDGHARELVRRELRTTRTAARAARSVGPRAGLGTQRRGCQR